MNQFSEIDRRQWLSRAFLLVGAMATGGCDFGGLGSAKGKTGLDKDQMALLTAVADTIIPATDTPGAVAAGVPPKLDGMLTNWASSENRKLVVEALGRIERAANVAKNKGFAVLNAAEREAVLRPHDAAALKSVPAPPDAPKGNLFAPAIWVADEGYLKLKSLIISLYYSSEIAMTKELIYEHVPGEWQPSIKATDKTRPWAGVDPF